MRLDQLPHVGRRLAASALALFLTVGCQALPLVTTELRISAGAGSSSPDLQSPLSATPYPASETHFPPGRPQYRPDRCVKGEGQRLVKGKKPRKPQVGRLMGQTRGC
jgi:hypothetical protein